MKRLVLSSFVVLLAGCGSTTLTRPFRSYNRAYADTLNEQMLLNLARLHNGHPPYFLAVGTINNRYTFSGEASGGGNWTNTDTATSGGSSSITSANSVGHQTGTPLGVLGVLSRGVTSVVGATVGTAASVVSGGTVGGKIGASNSPDFQLIPLNNDTVAKQLLEPISTDVFFTLYQQGLPIDQLLRVLVERIETTLPNGENIMLVNSPTGGTQRSFGRFLRACAILREMQRNGDLLMDTKRDTKVIGTTGANWKMSGKDLLDANEKKLTYHKNDDGTQDLIQQVSTPTFFLRSGSIEKTKSRLYGVGLTDDHEAIDHVVELLSRGIVVKGRSDDGQNAYSRLTLRSYSRALEAAATEQDGFDALMQDPEFTKLVPASEHHPILRTLWTGKQPKLSAPVQSVSYAGKTYMVTDAVTTPLDPAVRWNRDVFKLLVALGSQVSVDISKFQRQVLELR